MLIRVANQIQDKQISGGPKWLFEDRYNILSTGTAPGREGTFYEKLKTLLADRFKLVTHMEKREQSVLALVRVRADGKLGPKMTPSTVDCTPSGPNRRGTAASPTPGADPRCGFNFGPGRMLVGGQTPAAFAAALALFAGDIVVDRTGLTGLYDFELSFAPDASVNSDLPSIFAAVQEQLGLKSRRRRVRLTYSSLTGWRNRRRISLRSVHIQTFVGQGERRPAICIPCSHSRPSRRSIATRSSRCGRCERRRPKRATPPRCTARSV